MVHTIFQKCQKCDGFDTNKTRFVFTELVPSDEVKRGGVRKTKMWSSECRSCGHKDGKNFTQG